jgi:hypothetical protein
MSINGICPSNESEWEAQAKARDIGSLHGFAGELSSASKLDVDQFLALKTVWQMEPNINALSKNPWAARLGTTPEKILAVRHEMKQERAWKEYLESIGKLIPPNGPFEDKLGRFAMVLQNQRIATKLTDAKTDEQKVGGSPMVTRSGLQLGQVQAIPILRWGPGVAGGSPQPKHPSPPRPESNPRSNSDSHSSRAVTEASVSIMSWYDEKMSKAERATMADEQVINTAAISFLQGLFVGDAGRNAYWSPQRKGFQFGKSSFKAYTDGHLQIIGEARSAAILEVKARKRPIQNANDFKIEWQESAQMALWIRDEPSSYWTTEDDRHKCR